MKRAVTFQDAVKAQSQARDNYEKALAAGDVYYLAKPGFIALRACADKNVIERMAARRDGYKCYSQSDYNQMLAAYGIE